MASSIQSPCKPTQSQSIDCSQLIFTLKFHTSNFYIPPIFWGRGLVFQSSSRSIINRLDIVKCSVLVLATGSLRQKVPEFEAIQSFIDPIPIPFLSPQKSFLRFCFKA